MQFDLHKLKKNSFTTTTTTRTKMINIAPPSCCSLVGNKTHAKKSTLLDGILKCHKEKCTWLKGLEEKSNEEKKKITRIHQNIPQNDVFCTRLLVIFRCVQNGRIGIAYMYLGAVMLTKWWSVSLGGVKLHKSQQKEFESNERP